jgi:hypothetical protein
VTHVKRQFMIATLAAAAVGIAGCGNEETAGNDIGFGIGALQATTTTKVADERLEGIRTAIESLDGKLPEDVVKQLETIDEELEEGLKEAVNHPDEIQEVSSDAAAAIAGLSSSDDAVKKFQKAVAESYKKGAGQ